MRLGNLRVPLSFSRRAHLLTTCFAGGGIPPVSREHALSEGDSLPAGAAGCGLHKGLRKKHDYAEVTTNSDFLFIGESYQPWHRPICGGSFRLHEL